MNKSEFPVIILCLFVFGVASGCSSDEGLGALPTSSTLPATSLPLTGRVNLTATTTASPVPLATSAIGPSATLILSPTMTFPASLGQAGDMPPTLLPRYVTPSSLGGTATRTSTRSATPSPTGRQGAQTGSGMSGTVKSVSGATIQITKQDGNILTAKTDAQTTFQKIASAALTDVKPGASVMVMGTMSGTTMIAQSIQIGASFGPPAGTPPVPRGSPPSGGIPPPRPSGQPGNVGQPGVGGTVKSVSGKTILVTAPNGNTITVLASDQTSYQKTTSATLADVQAGGHITVMGDSSGSMVTARIVQIGSTGQ
jgi:hypothetical protein